MIELNKKHRKAFLSLSSEALQRVEKATASLITDIKPRDHTPILIKFHWLPVN